jgi:hypothetical protein
VSDWHVGDLAMFVPTNYEGRWYPEGYGVSPGTVRRVDGVIIVNGETGLIFNDHPSPHATRAWSHLTYRKIRPDAHEGNVEDWNLILETTKRRAAA